jgi:hypothetical protein
MIKVEGYMAFHGGMKVTPPAYLNIEPFVLEDRDWLYKPSTDCWYGDGRSFPEAVCEPIEN